MWSEEKWGLLLVQGWSQGGGVYLKWAQRAWFDWINLGLRRRPAPGTGGEWIFFFPVAFFLVEEKRWALELGWNVIIGQHQTRETPPPNPLLRILVINSICFKQDYNWRSTHSLFLCACTTDLAPTIKSLLSSCFFHLISFLLYSPSSLDFYMPAHYGPKRKGFI